jgi:hypothetical protein
MIFNGIEMNTSSKNTMNPNLWASTLLYLANRYQGAILYFSNLLADVILAVRRYKA